MYVWRKAEAHILSQLVTFVSDLLQGAVCVVLLAIYCSWLCLHEESAFRIKLSNFGCSLALYNFLKHILTSFSILSLVFS